MYFSCKVPSLDDVDDLQWIWLFVFFSYTETYYLSEHLHQNATTAFHQNATTTLILCGGHSQEVLLCDNSRRCCQHFVGRVFWVTVGHTPLCRVSLFVSARHLLWGCCICNVVLMLLLMPTYWRFWRLEATFTGKMHTTLLLWHDTYCCHCWWPLLVAGLHAMLSFLWCSWRAKVAVAAAAPTVSPKCSLCWCSFWFYFVRALLLGMCVWEMLLLCLQCMVC